MMDTSEKLKIKIRLGLTLQKIIQKNKEISKQNKEIGKIDHKAITSLRKLAAAAAIEFSIIQRISSGKKNAEVTTLVGIVEGLRLTMTDFFAIFDSITEKEILTEIARHKKNKSAP